MDYNPVPGIPTLKYFFPPGLTPTRKPGIPIRSLFGNRRVGREFSQHIAFDIHTAKAQFFKIGFHKNSVYIS
jgi:hypothetical protein